MTAKMDLSEDHSNQTLKSIFSLLHENMLAYMKSADLQSEELLRIRTRRIRRSRTIKASSCPPKSDIYYVKDQGTAMTPPESPSEATSPDYQHVLTVPVISIENSIETPSDLGECPKGNADCLSGMYPSKEELNTETVHVSPFVNNRKPHHLSVPSCERPLSKDQVQQYNNPAYIRHTVEEQHLTTARENVDLKVQMQELNRMLKNLKKSTKDDEEEYNEKLAVIDGILSKVVTVQKQSEILCDKLCEGLEQIPRHQSISTLPPELKDFCNRIGRTVGQDFKQIGRELGLEDDILDQIENDFQCEDDCFHHIILEWCKRHETPSYHALVSACHKVNPDILKSNPLSKDKAKILQQNYNMMCTEMLEIHVLPHLVSAGILSFKMQRYVLKPNTRDQRINRLISIILTRENGFDELCKALDDSDQGHVSSILRDAWDTTLQTNVSTTDDHDITENFMSTRRRHWTSGRYQSQDSSEDCCNELSDSSFSVGSPTLDSAEILRKIYEMISQTGILPK